MEARWVPKLLVPIFSAMSFVVFQVLGLAAGQPAKSDSVGVDQVATGHRLALEICRLPCRRAYTEKTFRTRNSPRARRATKEGLQRVAEPRPSGFLVPNGRSGAIARGAIADFVIGRWTRCRLASLSTPPSGR